MMNLYDIDNFLKIALKILKRKTLLWDPHMVRQSIFYYILVNIIIYSKYFVFDCILLKIFLK